MLFPFMNWDWLIAVVIQDERGWSVAEIFPFSGIRYFLWWKRMLFSFVNWDSLIAVVEVEVASTIDVP